MEKKLPSVTIVVTPRERFSYTQVSLESIYEQTTVPFELVYVDGNSPSQERDYIKKQSELRGFKLIRTEHYLWPQRSRNLGLAEVKTPYVVFLDNDVVVKSGWLRILLECAETQGAAVVGPLMCHEEPIHEIVHFAGGESHIVVDVKSRRHLREKMYLQGRAVAAVRPNLEQCETELCEFHCMLVRTDVFEQLGPFDESILNTKEHLDFCMNVMALGQTVYFEPDSVVTYVPGPPLAWRDLRFYMLRWSNAWELVSLDRLKEKWDLCEDGYFKHKYKALGWRRRDAILQPLLDKIGLTNRRSLPNKLLMFGLLAPIEKTLNQFMTWQYARQHLQTPLSKPPAVAQPIKSARSSSVQTATVSQ
ncbi:MAG: glycosyl transferase family 2 [Leptolyngbya foveolarum]|uniref:Glycosyl transferase family 2 n=1 Tax=Leptolyngbya foveolarum TaxID=47253 RepID=A0A2W4VXI3_9CYAN|nr:MAG: glycosyl transferase family 2 [Leptolyngbya foveolarum]